MRILKSIQVLETEESLGILIEVEKQNSKLRKQGEAAEFWIGTLDNNGVTSTMKTMDILEYFVGVMKKTKVEEIPIPFIDT